MDLSTEKGNKKLFITGAIGLLVVLVLGFFIWRFFAGLYSGGDTIPSDPNRTATLSFAETNITATPGQDLNLSILLDTGDISVTEANAVILYDPKALTLNSLLPANPNLFGTSSEYQVTQSTVDNNKGQAIFKIKVVDTTNPPSTTRQGNQKIAEAMFTVNEGFKGTTSLVFYQNETTPDVSSMVRTQNYNGSILKSSTETTVTVK